MKRVDFRRFKYLVCCFTLSSIALHAENVLEPQNESDHFFLTTYAASQKMIITPDAGPAVKNGIDMYVEADYIYWHASEGGLSYAQEGIPAAGLPTSSNNVLIAGPVARPSFKFSSGFKVGVGVDTDYDGWSLASTYTWLFSHAIDSFEATALTLWESNFSVLPVNQRDTLTVFQITANSGNADWTLHFNALDLDLGRGFFVSPHLILRPHFGLKASWIKQLYTILYNDQGISTLINTAAGTTSGYVLAGEQYNIANEQYIWGLGLRVGLDTTWMITKNLSVFGNASFSELWGQITQNRIDTSNVDNLVANTSVLENFISLNNTDGFAQITPILELAVGVQYDYWFCDSSYRLRMQAGWEAQTWFDQNHFLKQGIYGNLNLQGLTINLKFDF